MQSRFLIKNQFQSSLGFLTENNKNNIFRTLKTNDNHWFFMVFQGFTVFAFSTVLQGFFLQNGAQGVILAFQKSHKGPQRVPKSFFLRPSGAAEGVLLLPLCHLASAQAFFLTLHGGSETSFQRFGSPNMEFSRFSLHVYGSLMPETQEKHVSLGGPR